MATRPGLGRQETKKLTGGCFRFRTKDVSYWFYYVTCAFCFYRRATIFECNIFFFFWNNLVLADALCEKGHYFDFRLKFC